MNQFESIATILNTLVSVTVGFLLAEGLRYGRERRRITKLKGMIKEELESIRHQVAQKRGIVSQMLQALSEEKLLSGISVAILNTGYNHHISELYEHLSALERNCLHVIHERLALADQILNDFENDYVQALNNAKQSIGYTDDPQRIFAAKLLEIDSLYEVVDKLIKSYLDGKPENVFYLDTIDWDERPE